MSNYTFTFPQEVYRWLVADQIIPNKGQLIDKGLVNLSNELSPNFENGFFVSEIIKIVLSKSGQGVPSNLLNVKAENSKNTRMANWNFIWISFDQLRMQFDTRIKDLIIQGESALITEIIKQLFERDENKDEKTMKQIIINLRLQQSKIDLKGKTNAKPHALDIKKINTQKDPNDSQSSLEFLILLLTSAFNMPTEEILGLFTNQNKYLAHLIVKGINEDFTGVILFYSLLNKYSKKLKEFCDSDKKDAESCFYAIKPGLISKSPKVAELTVEVFFGVKNIYEWFVSDSGKCSTTLFLGIKRHPNLVSLYWDLLLHVIQNEEIQFFTQHFKKSFRDAEQMIQTCTLLIAPLANSFLKDKVIDLGILQQWIEIGINLFEGNLENKLLSYKFVGQIMSMMPQIIEESEDCLIIFKNGWTERKLIDFIYLFDEIIMILQELAGQKNTMARKVYQIIIEIFDAVIQSDDKREYLVRNFVDILPQFPKIPTQFLIENYRENSLKPHDLELIKCSINLSNDANCLSKIGEVILRMFNNQAVQNNYLAPIIFSICKKILHEEIGQPFVFKVVKDCLYCYSQLQITKKIPQLAKQQPMYFIQKGNSQKHDPEQEDLYKIGQKQGKNILILVEKLSQLVLSNTLQNLERSIKLELLDTNAFIRKNNFKVSNKGISNILAKRFAVSKEEESAHQEDYKNRKSINTLEESIARRKLVNSSSIPMASSRYGGPEHIKKQFNEVTEKRKRQQEEKRFQQEKKAKQEQFKKILVKKELQKTNLLRGFAHQAELKEDGFWAKFMKQDNKELQLYPPELMQARDLQYIENIFKKYHRVLRSLFFKYTSSMYTTKINSNFEDNKDRNQTLSLVELIKFLKDYKLFFLTNHNQLQNLVRDLNVKLLNKRETQDLDFSGFQQFVIQFCALIYTKAHTINANTSKGVETIRKSLGHLSHLQLVEEWFNYLKLVFLQKGEKTSIFDEPQAAYFNETEVIKEFNRKIQQDPTFILPEGYKKITEKVIKLSPNLSEKNKVLKQSYRDVFEILDEILSTSTLQIHLIEPMSVKQTKVRVKPHAFVNVKAKLLQASDTKVRALSSVIEKKTAIPPIKMLQKKTLTFGMKLGLSYVSYKDKLLGEQVAYVIDDMINAVENGKNTIQKEKIINQALKKRQELSEKEKFAEMDRQKKRLERKNQLEKMKKQITQQKEKQADLTKEEREKKKQKELSKEKKIKQDKEKYLQEQQSKIKQKKKKDQEEQNKKKADQLKKKQEEKKKKEKFKQFNTKEIQKFKKGLDEQAEKKKKVVEQEEQQKKHKQQLVKKLRSKIHDSDKKAIEYKQKVNQQISELYNSAPIKDIFSQFESNLKGLFDFLLKNTFTSLTERKHNNEIISDTWHYFNYVFQLCPLIISAKDLGKIFKSLTKEKQSARDYHLGLTYDEFQQALLRVAIKHKSIFNKLSEKIKDTMNQQEINQIVQKDIEQKEKNEFEEPKQIDVKGLMKEEDIKKEFTDHYGDISKVNDKTLKGLIYYLKVPKDKMGQEKRFREILASKITYNIPKAQQLKEKLNEEYSLPTVPAKKKKKSENNQSQIIKQNEQNAVKEDAE